LLRILKYVTNDKIYSLEFTKVVIDHIWEQYEGQIRWKTLFPFFLQLIVSHAYFIGINTYDGELWEGSVEPVLRYILFILTILFGIFESF
jgi:hypothetical protein